MSECDHIFCYGCLKIMSLIVEKEEKKEEEEKKKIEIDIDNDLEEDDEEDDPVEEAQPGFLEKLKGLKDEKLE